MTAEARYNVKRIQSAQAILSLVALAAAIGAMGAWIFEPVTAITWGFRVGLPTVALLAGVFLAKTNRRLVQISKLQAFDAQAQEQEEIGRQRREAQAFFRERELAERRLNEERDAQEAAMIAERQVAAADAKRRRERDAGSARATAEFRDGFPLEYPALVLPWDLNTDSVESFLQQHGVNAKKLTANQYTIPCTSSLAGVFADVVIDFGVNPSGASRNSKAGFLLTLLWLGRTRECYEPTREKLVDLLGEPNDILSGGDAGPDFPDLAWTVDGFQIILSSRFLKDNQDHLQIDVMPNAEERP